MYWAALFWKKIFFIKKLQIWLVLWNSVLLVNNLFTFIFLIYYVYSRLCMEHFNFLLNLQSVFNKMVGIFIYIYIYIYIYLSIRCPDELLRQNYSRLVPDSLSNYHYYFALLSIEYFLHCSLAALTVVFSFDFFQLIWQGWPFLFFPKYIYIYIYIFFRPLWQWVVYFHLQITCWFFKNFLTIRAII